MNRLGACKTRHSHPAIRAERLCKYTNTRQQCVETYVPYRSPTDWSLKLLPHLCGRVFPGEAVREARLRHKDECVEHARGRARVAAVQKMVNGVDIFGGAVREEKTGRPSPPGRQRRCAYARRSSAKPVHEIQDRYDAVREHEELHGRPAADESISQTGSEQKISFGCCQTAAERLSPID